MTSGRPESPGPSLQRRLAAGTAALVIAASLASLGYTVMASRSFYFDLRTEALTATVRSVEAVVRAAPDDATARTALQQLLAGEPLVGAVRGRVTLDGRPLMERNLTAVAVARIDAAMAPMATVDAAAASASPRFTEVRFDDGDHEVVQWEARIPRGWLQVTLADPDADTLARRDREVLFAIGATAAVAGVGVGAAWMIVALGLRPIRRVAATLDGIGDRPPSALPVEAWSSPREIRPLLDALDRLLRRLDAAFARERRFTADAAHELRTLLAGLRSTIELARSRPRDGEADDRTLADAAEAGARLDRLAAALLDLAAADAAVQGARSSSDLAVTTQSVIEELRPLAAGCGIHLDLEVTGPEPHVPLAPDEAARVIVNLLGNAIHHGPAGGRVRVRVHSPPNDGPDPDDPRPIGLDIHDEGTLLVAEDLERIFDRFVRGTFRGSEPSETGSGLGLALVRELVTRAGGQVSAHCDSAEGTRFSVRLPRTGPRLSTGPPPDQM